ncbi:D-2-hydroxyacid dehydrogenase [Loigolactobacillus bifermentans]|jgi:D-lactate dehydrogenase|uniref:D-lactate dehydrogenase n=1 Tax=Loigolactobacillus bifermentans DSM 20003 TaxID=1423726 RepID=A0A0R1GGA9_9LACO|nr:D-2-hydroxyacid dehydrogenase [Loigolactobacillus bifermentans]KRK33135.1 D-lactate dehydrogenase [Loigolactobacillus bifermentans DSM 20003]QGG60488.1 lactate dehydrogenase [Loigolactobacillus bifermentans]
MKIVAYGIRDDERPYVAQWSESQNVEVKIVSALLDEDTVEQAKGYDGAVVYQQKPYTAAVLDKLASYGITALSLRNVGVDNIDADAIKRNGFKVTNVPAYSPAAIAELSVTQLMRLLRYTNIFDKKQAAGNLKWAPDIALELNQMTVGVVATGRIGRAAIQIYKGFGAKVIAYDVFRNPTLEAEGMYVDTLDELYAQADVITLHAPATKDNDRMINDESIAKMKDGVFLVNAARGALIDTDALIKGLDSGKIAGAAIDTYEDEVGVFNTDFGSFDAIPDARLKDLMLRDNVLVTPHIAFYTTTAVKNMVQFALTSNKNLIETGSDDSEVAF